MRAKAIDKIIKLLKIPAFFILFAHLSFCASLNLRGFDYFFHIKAGEHIVTQKEIPKKEVFSFTMKGKEWSNHEWLYQIFIYSLYNKFGLESLFLIKLVVFGLFFFLLTLMVLKTDWVFGFPLIFYGLKIAIGRFTLRPDNLSLLFLILFLTPFIFKKRRLLFLLPFIQILWVNIHGFFFLGPLILLIYLLLGRRRAAPEKKFYKTVKIIFLFTLLACFLSPQPLATVSYPAKIVKDVVSGQQKLFFKHIQELQSPLKDVSGYYPFFGYLIGAFICLLFFKNLSPFYIGLYLVMAAFSLNSIRNVYFFIPVGVAIFVDRFPYIKEVFLKQVLRERGFLLVRLLCFYLTLAICINMVKDFIRLPRYGVSYITSDREVDIKSRFLAHDPVRYPQQMLDFINRNDLPRRMFNNFNLGAVLIFNSFPQREVFIDGRGELYGLKFFSQYIDMLDANVEAFDTLSKKYRLEGFAISYLQNSPPDLVKLIHERGFKCIYFDLDGIIFVSKEFLHKTPALKRYFIDFRSYKFKQFNLLKSVKLKKPFTQGYFNMGLALYKMGYLEKAKECLEELLRIVPDHARSYYYLAKIYYRKAKYQEAFRYCRSSIFFAPGARKARKLLARIYIKTGDYEEARDTLARLKVDFDKFNAEIDKAEDE